MDKGIYVSLLPKGKIKRTLTTESGEVELPETTIADEIILFSELDFEHYAQVVELLNTIADAIPSPPKNLTQEEINAYDLLLDTTEDCGDVFFFKADIISHSFRYSSLPSAAK